MLLYFSYLTDLHTPYNPILQVQIDIYIILLTYIPQIQHKDYVDQYPVIIHTAILLGAYLTLFKIVIEHFCLRFICFGDDLSIKAVSYTNNAILLV